MKKYIVLTILFVLPLVVYLFFASGINHFAKLPVLTNDVYDISKISNTTIVTIERKNNTPQILVSLDLNLRRPLKISNLCVLFSIYI